MKISIVTPNYNYGHFIEATLRSVLNQDYADLEYIVLDDGSTDGSVDTIRRYADRLSHWETAPNQGQYKTLTRGFAPIEQHTRGHIGPWTDLYAVGATMWACLCGKAPPTATKRAEKDTYKPAARQFSSRYSRQLLEAVDWCLQMDQMARPQNVDALLDFLNKEPSDLPAQEPETLIERLKQKLPW